MIHQSPWDPTSFSSEDYKHSVYWGHHNNASWQLPWVFPRCPHGDGASEPLYVQTRESSPPRLPSLPHSETFSEKWVTRKSIIYALPVTYQTGWEDIDLPDGRPPLTSWTWQVVLTLACGLLGSFLYLTPAPDSRRGPVNFGYTIRRDGRFELSHSAGLWPSPRRRRWWWARGVSDAPVKNGPGSTVRVIAEHHHLCRASVLWELRFRGGLIASLPPWELLSSEVAPSGQRAQLSTQARWQGSSVLPERRLSVMSRLWVGRRAPAGTLHSPLCPLDAGSCNPGLERSSRGFSKRIHTLSQYAGWSGLFIFFPLRRDIYIHSVGRAHWLFEK